MRTVGGDVRTQFVQKEEEEEEVFRKFASCLSGCRKFQYGG